MSYDLTFVKRAKAQRVARVKEAYSEDIEALGLLVYGLAIRLPVGVFCPLLLLLLVLVWQQH